MSLIFRLLVEGGFRARLFSIASVAERSLKAYPGFSAELEGDLEGVEYCAALDVPFLSHLVSYADLRRRLRDAHRRQPFDVVLLYSCMPTESAAAVALARRAGIPLIVDLEDDPAPMVHGTHKWKSVAWSYSLRSLRAHTRGVIAVTPRLAASFGAEHTLCLPGALDPDMLPLMTQWEPPATGVRHAVFAGSMQLGKGVERLCAAWKLANPSNAVLDLYGDGPELGRLRQNWEGPTIFFHGRVSRTRLVCAFGSAALFANPHDSARCRQGQIFPFKLIEYAGSGRPVITTPIQDIDLASRIGLCLAPDDSPDSFAAAIKSVLGDYTPWLIRARDAQARVWQEYGPATLRDKLRQMICAVIGRAR
jgi:glycosyltransferase involved in cell wall biosynthesis